MKDPARRERFRTFLLLPVVVVAVLVLSGGSFRASFQLDKLREKAVVDASLELANARAARLDQMIIEQDNAVAQELDVGSPQESSERWLEIADRLTPTVRALMVVSLHGQEREVVAHASRAPGPADDEFRQLVLYKAFADLELAAPREQLRHLHRDYDGQSYLFSYWQRDYLGRTFLLIAWHDVARLVHDYLPKLYGEKDQQSRVNVVDGQGRIIFGPPLSGELTVGRQFQTTLYKWRLNVALTTAEELAASAERRMLLEIVLAALSAVVVIAGAIVILNAASRERRLANLKSEFVANVSHELKTPLSLIRMFGELLQTGRVGSDEKRLQYLSIIVTESERLGALIENVLDFSRAERGEAYSFSEANLGDVVTRAVDVCRVRAERQNTALELNVEAGLPASMLDERAIEIAVINLIDNALKYGADGNWVGVQVCRGRRHELVVVVRDRGDGILAEDRERIFERFVRRDTQKRARGSGIGLALVQHVARAHGGRAWVEANLPSGSAFYLSIKATR